MMGARIFTPGDWGLVAAVGVAQLALLVLPVPAIGPSGVALISLTLVSVILTVLRGRVCYGHIPACQ